MQKRPLTRLRSSLQSLMLKQGARLSALDANGQILVRTGDNNVEGKEITSQSASQGEIIAMENVQPQPGQAVQPSVMIPPAGGLQDAGNVLAQALVKAGRAIENENSRTYGQRALNAAIPSAIYVGAVLVAYTGVVLIERKWGKEPKPLPVTVVDYNAEV